MEGLIRISDILLCDVFVRGKRNTYGVDEVILNRNGNVSGLVVSNKGILQVKHYASAKSIERLTKEQIYLKGMERYTPKQRSAQYASGKLLKKRVRASDGEVLGVLSDVYISGEKLRVMAVEIAVSLFEDLFLGRTLIPGNIIVDDVDSVVISDLQMENSLHNTKGIINAIDDGFKEKQ
ncbi:MAG: PRC-barrel domain-containing protein [Clostridia bacterium]|nr:PRC-barrel domain-containing protein [Clostridia bacterium]